jgi:hypothetical protein
MAAAPVGPAGDARPEWAHNVRRHAWHRTVDHRRHPGKLAKTPHTKESLQRQIDAMDRQIDQLAYELYGLTANEIRIVEKGIDKK